MVWFVAYAPIAGQFAGSHTLQAATERLVNNVGIYLHIGMRVLVVDVRSLCIKVIGQQVVFTGCSIDVSTQVIAPFVSPTVVQIALADNLSRHRVTQGNTHGLWGLVFRFLLRLIIESIVHIP